ncbi:hypothetical protein ACHQM5_009320 [Ranunculus cassubicifolius]
MAIIRPNTQGQEQAPQHPEGAIHASAPPEQHQQQQPVFVQPLPSFHQAPQHIQQQPVLIQSLPSFQQYPQQLLPNPSVIIPSPWTTGLFGCFDDMPNCLITALCPCVTFGQIAEISERGMTTCFSAGCIYCLILGFLGCPCFYSCCFRSKLRMIFTLPEAPCADCFVHTFCEYCALCQEYRELKNRGADPNAGWQAYAQKVNQNQGVPMMSPIIAQSMMR